MSGSLLALAAAATAAATAFMSPVAQAAQSARPLADGRIGELHYNAGDVYALSAQRGYVVHIALASEEHIQRTRAGDKDGWVVDAEVGSHDIYLKPKDAAHPTNLEVTTDQRNYSFELRVPDKAVAVGVYRVTFVYDAPVRVAPVATPAVTSAATLASAPSSAAGEGALLRRPTVRTSLADKLLSVPEIRNSNYTLQAAPGSDDIVPRQAYDDGRFMYLSFPGNREVPTVFRLTSDGTEALVNSHVEGDVLVVHELSARLVRLGAQVVAIWNEDFDAEGAPPVGGVTVEGVVRTLRDTQELAP